MKIAACILAIPVGLCLSAYIAWIAFGSYLLAIMDSDRRGMTICRNIWTYIVVMYIYLGCLVVFGLIVGVWKIHKEMKGSSGPSAASAAERGAQADTDKQMKNVKHTAKLMKAMPI